MQRLFLARFFFLVVLLAAPRAGQAWWFWGAEQPYEETTSSKGWHPFLRAKRPDPTAQLEYAGQLEQEGRIKKALKQYRALVIHWPESDEAPLAQLQYARLLDQRKKYLNAFDEYQFLFDRYTGKFPYNELLDRQFEIARMVMDMRKGKFLFLPGFSAPERATPLFEKIIKNGPAGPNAAEAQYLIGVAHEANYEYEEAVVAYMATQHRYPESPSAEKAAFGQVRCYYLLAQEGPHNEEALENAWAAVTLFLNTYPASEDKATATSYRNVLYGQRAKAAYDKAIFYDRLAKKPKAALIAYETMVGLFPNSDWTALAQARIDELKQIVEPDNEKSEN